VKPILCLDFDGVIHSYSSGWKGADVIPDPPVPGAFAFIVEALQHFRVAIFSSRSNQPGGIEAMQAWMTDQVRQWKDPAPWEDVSHELAQAVEWPTEKPAAFLTIDDRAVCFNGDFEAYDMPTLLAFKPWNKQ
jgi:hypothetical protein